MRRSGFRAHQLERRPVRQWESDRLPRARETVQRVAEAPGSEPIPKVKPVRSNSYLRWVATLPCACCGIEGSSQAAHTNYGRGLGQKASDLETFPLCCSRPGIAGCHRDNDTLVGLTLEQRRIRETIYIEETQAQARAAGRKEIQ